MSEQKQAIQALLKKNGLGIESVFIPFSKSRNAGNKYPSLNWEVTLIHNGRKILTTAYSAGCGHAPSYQQRETIYSREHVTSECERGYTTTSEYGFNKKPILPDSVDVIYSLLMDSEVLEAGAFEDWAGEFGYDTDSRDAERLYNACLKIALQFRKIGESLIAELREAYQDY